MIFFGTALIREADPRLIPNSITPDELLKWIERTAEVDAVNPTELTPQPNTSAVSEATYYPETLTMTFKLAGRRDTRYVYRGRFAWGFIVFFGVAIQGRVSKGEPQSAIVTD